MKIIYAGTPEFAVLPLKAILEAGYEVAAVVTQEDKPVGRKGIVTPSPVKVFALEHGIPVFQPKKIRQEVEALKTFGGDCMITCAFGQILSLEVLQLYPLGVWNIHASLLPKYRGAAPIQQCIIDGEEYTGVTIMKTDEGLDTGDILRVARVNIEKNETAGELSLRLSAVGANLITESLPEIESGEPLLLLQDNAKATLVKKITKDQAKIDWNKENTQIVNLIRGMNPSPVAYFTLQEKNINVYRATAIDHVGEDAVGTVLSVPKKLAVKCGKGAVVLEQLQLPGGKIVNGSDVLNGRKILQGQLLQ